MWILLKESFAGRLNGQTYNLIGGSKYDMPEPAVKQLRDKLGKDAVLGTVAPWEEHVDHKTAKHNAFMAKVKAAIAAAEKLEAECEQIVNSIDTLQQQLRQKQKEMDNAVKEAKKLAKAAGINWPPKDAGKSEG